MEKNCKNCIRGGTATWMYPCNVCLAAPPSDVPEKWEPTADRVNEIMQAEREGRLVILPCRENAELKMNGKTYRGDHWNHTLTAFRDDPTTRSGKQVALFSIETAEKALEEVNG